MKTLTAGLPLAMAVIATTVYAGDRATFTGVTPIFSQVIAVEYPNQFRMVNEETKSGSYIQESVKAGETVNKWSEMITVTGHKGIATVPNASAKDFVLKIAKSFQPACPATFATVELGPQQVDGREGFAVIASCGRVSTAEEAAAKSSHSETAVILGIKGSADLYTIQWALRGQPSAQPLSLDAAVWNQRLKQLEPIRVCQHGPNEIQDCAARK